MTPDRWQQLKQIFQSALERNPAERSAFLAQACGDDKILRSEVESLIASHDQAGDSIQAMAVDAATEILNEAGPIIGKQIGHYLITRRLGQGGMEANGLEKLVFGSSVSATVFRRFQYSAKESSG